MKPLVLSVGRGSLRARWPRDGDAKWSAESAFGSVAELRELLASLPGLAGFPAGVRRVSVVLEEGVVQRRTLRELPPVSPAALRELVALQQARFFRRNGHLLQTNARWEKAPRGTPRVAVAVAIEPAWLEAISQGVAEAGLRLGEVVSLDTALEFLPEGEQERRSRSARKRLRWLAVGSIVSWMAAALVHGGRLVTADHRLDRELAQLREPADALLRARRELAGVADAVTAVESSANRRKQVAGRVHRIVTALPDSSFLSSLTVDERGHGYLTGAARQAATVVARLDRAAVAPGVALEGETVPEGGPRGWERFTIRLGRGGTP